MNELFDVKNLQNRVETLSAQLPSTGRGYYRPDAYTVRYKDTRSAVENEIAKAQAELGVAEQYQNDVMSANRSGNQQINAAALGRARRAAGGGTFKRRGSAVSANQLVSNLGTANAKALAETRRAKALADVAASQAQRLTADQESRRRGTNLSIGAPIRIW